MKNRWLFLIIIFVLFLVIINYLSKPKSLPQTSLPAQAGNKIQIIASFYPLWEFARQVGGDKVEVYNITPLGAEPHDFEPNPQDLVKLSKAQMFIFNSIGFQPWVDKIISTLTTTKITVVNSSMGINVIKSEGIIDPHFWLDPNFAIIQVDNILQSLVKIDPINKNYYEIRAKDYKTQLIQLDNDFRQSLIACKQKEIITSHSMFAYLSKRYNIEALSIAGLSPSSEPNTQTLAEIAKIAKNRNIKYIFFETLVSPKLANTLAQEVGAKTLVFNPLEGLTNDEVSQNKNYISVQKENLSNLKIALECK